MKKSVFFVITLLNINYVIAQMNILIINSPNQSANIYQIEGEKLIFFDSLFIRNNKLKFNKTLANGLYRLVFDQNKWINFVSDFGGIALETDYNNILDSLRIINSESNKLYYDFLGLNKDYKRKTELLNLILARFPQEDKYYNITQKRLKEIKNEYLEFINETAQSDPKSFIARFISTSQFPVIPDSLKNENQLNYLKSHSLDHVDFDDAELIYSDAFTNKTIEYLTYYRNPQLPKELLEKEFMKAVDTLLSKAKVNQLVYQHITDYLIEGFRQFGFDKIIDYIIENYVIADDLCLEEELENSIQKRIDQSKLFPIGTKVPNIIMPDINGEVIDLLAIQEDKTLLVFYSSQCPHCKTLLPKLNELQKKQKDLNLIAISLDNNQEEWTKFVQENKLDLININDPNGWDGHLASDFYIYATPTMFLLDNEKKIIGKPINYKELLSLF